MKSDMRIIKNLLFLFEFTCPGLTAESIRTIWDKSIILREYPKPPLQLVEAALKEFRNEH
jgi:hypothetical protein